MFPISALQYQIGFPFPHLTRHSGGINNADFPKLSCPCAWKPRGNMSSDFQPLSFTGYVGYIERASVQVILVSDSKNLSPWPEETVIDPQETVCKCVLKMTFYFAMDDRNVKMLSTFTNAMWSSKISANTHCDTRLKISYVPQEKEPPRLGLSCLILLQGGLHSKVGPILPQFFPGNHPEIRWNCNIFNCFDKDVRTSTTSCSALNWLHLCKQAAHKHKNHHLLQGFPDSGSTHN